jgi:AraC-like DNA-binding protein
MQKLNAPCNEGFPPGYKNNCALHSLCATILSSYKKLFKLPGTKNSVMTDIGGHSSQFFITRQVPQALSHYIENLWIWSGAPRPSGFDRILPTGAPGLIFNLLEDETRIYKSSDNTLSQRLDGCGFDGAHMRPFVIDTREQIYVAGVNFRPGGAWPFIKAAQDELLNTHLSLKDLWGRDAESLREQLLLAKTPSLALLILEQVLLRKLHKPMQRHSAVQYALDKIQSNPGSIRVEECLQSGNVGSRRLTRLFELETGMTPKRFARLLRFRQVISHLHKSKGLIDWSDLALRYGYYDQAHFSREFRDFSGFTPTSYLPLIGEFENHVAVS